MKLEQIRLHRDDLILAKHWRPAGETESGIYLEHADSLPIIFADVVLAPSGCAVCPGDFILFPRYAGSEVNLEEGVFHFINVDDVECILDEHAEPDGTFTNA